MTTTTTPTGSSSGIQGTGGSANNSGQVAASLSLNATGNECRCVCCLGWSCCNTTTNVIDPRMVEAQKKWEDDLRQRYSDLYVNLAFRFIPKDENPLLAGSMTSEQMKQIEEEAGLIAATYHCVKGLVKQGVDASVQEHLVSGASVSSTLGHGASSMGITEVTKKDGTSTNFEQAKVDAAIAAEGKIQGWTEEDVDKIKKGTFDALQAMSGSISALKIQETWLGVAKSLGCLVKPPVPEKQLYVPGTSIDQQFVTDSVDKLNGNQYHSLLVKYGIPTSVSAAPVAPSVISSPTGMTPPTITTTEESLPPSSSTKV